jgi:predicted transcriptional regulator
MAGLSLRLPDELEVRLANESREEGVPRSEVARAAIVEFLDRRERERFMAAFVQEARAAYGNSAIRQEAREIAAEALPLDNESLARVESKPRSGVIRATGSKTRR